MVGIFIAPIDGDFDKTLSSMDQITNDWTAKAARGECGWVCSDCCSSFPDGMPDECAHGQQQCTHIIQRDKRAALEPTYSKGPLPETGWD